MKYNSDNVSLVFIEDGKELTDLLEQIFRILANSTEEGEKNVP
jgi:hypothetical protein